MPETEARLAEAIGVPLEALARMRREESFWNIVTHEETPWLERVSRIKEAILANALDPKRSDQWVWIKRYEQMTRKNWLHHGESDDE